MRGGLVSMQVIMSPRSISMSGMFQESYQTFIDRYVVSGWPLHNIAARLSSSPGCVLQAAGSMVFHVNFTPAVAFLGRFSAHSLRARVPLIHFACCNLHAIEATLAYVFSHLLKLDLAAWPPRARTLYSTPSSACNWGMRPAYVFDAF